MLNFLIAVMWVFVVNDDNGAGVNAVDGNDCSVSRDITAVTATAATAATVGDDDDKHHRYCNRNRHHNIRSFS